MAGEWDGDTVTIGFTTHETPTVPSNFQGGLRQKLATDPPIINISMENLHLYHVHPFMDDFPVKHCDVF